MNNHKQLTFAWKMYSEIKRRVDDLTMPGLVRAEISPINSPRPITKT
jgi:hypothetical protein